MEKKNIIAAVALSIAVLILYDMFVWKPNQTPQNQVESQGQTDGGTILPQLSLSPSEDPSQAQAPVATISRADALDGPRITIDTPELKGSIALVGARIDDLTLKQYRKSIDPDSDQIILFSPPGTPNPYYTTFGWLSAGEAVELPNHETLWSADNTRLSPGNPVTLRWTNAQNVGFEVELAIDQNFMFTVTQKIINDSGQAIDVAPYGLISRTGEPETEGFYILHEGLLGVLDGKLEEVDYSDLEDEGTLTYNSTGGWLGITDKYWMAALAPDQSKTIDARFIHVPPTNTPVKFQSDFHYPVSRVNAGAEHESVTRLFAGAKQAKLLDQYEEEYGIVNFDLAVDFGWFYFLTKPIFLALHWLHGLVGNFGVAILILTVLIKAVFFPLANRSYKAMAKMRALQPEMLKLRERFSDDKVRLQQEMMALYKKQGANPVSGCLPILIQIPVFFSLYKVLFVTIEMRHAPFFGWIQDLSAPDPTSLLNAFGLMPWDVPELGFMNIFNLGVWPLLMGLTMFAQQKLNPQPTDPTQARIFMMMPIVFTFLLATFPAGLVIYWTWNNLLSIIQQYSIMKMAGEKPGPKGKKGKSKKSVTAKGR